MRDPYLGEIIFPLLWIAGWLVASLVYRKLKGKPIFYKKPLFTRFRQRNASGNSNRNWLTRLGGAHNCLVVQVTDSELDIHPFAPFNWLFLPEIYGLEYSVPLSNIISAKIAKKLFRRGVEIEFKTSEGQVENIFLLLKKPDDFLLAIGYSEENEGQQFIKRGGVITAKPLGPGA